MEIIKYNMQFSIAELKTIQQGLTLLEEQITKELIKECKGNTKKAIDLYFESVCCDLKRKLTFDISYLERNDINEQKKKWNYYLFKARYKR